MLLNGLSSCIQVKMILSFGQIEKTRKKISKTTIPTKIGKLNRIFKPASRKKSLMSDTKLQVMHILSKMSLSMKSGERLTML
jgi:hypothetical protein